MTEIVIDGSYGEGGGQILRSALTLSLLTGRKVRIKNIRAKRPKPGLMAQHLKAVEAASRVGDARIDGAALGSQSLSFEPRARRGGPYTFDVGTAGSVSLIFQTIALPLWFADRPSEVDLTGGTHVSWSPCFHYLQHQWLHYLKEAGLEAVLELDLAGFYPKGGGRMKARIEPARGIRPLKLADRGRLKGIWGISAVANLDPEIAQRQRRRALERLSGVTKETNILVADLPARSPGTLLFLLARFERSQCCYYALGERGKPAEDVADEAAGALETFLKTDGAVDPYLADQLLLPLTFADGVSEIRTSRVTEHLLTNAWVLGQFVPVRIMVNEREARDAGLFKGETATVRVEGRGGWIQK